ncbi:methylated-DNA--[protein]-cysteine S-methyltransferase [Aureibacillus halotolerans]|uniref:Methylated-DNA--protein-cysteine methyltransferase n=1 Tax=Aureibacillus halotolerans TaxID=1508390 RepID=A0A4V3D4I6_9BACI|nr:methylated-DNA--[protein]-cysteine S-methyltransferase [Aureibacillus halotolerans]TDQ35438.1 methylated-DNA-[protein]-cysteine S-methyltransferase [Aureibacillus halotolerans]
MTISFYELDDTPLGTLTLYFSEKGLCRLAFGTYEERLEKETPWFERYFDNPSFEQINASSSTRSQLEEYFSGERTAFDVPLDLRGTDFQAKVWQALMDVPYGEMTAYKGIAETIASPKAVRAAGGAINKNPIPVIVPCHRVIGSDGSLVGYNGGLSIKKTLLEIEKR